MVLFTSSVSAASYTLFDDASIVPAGNPGNAAQIVSDTTPGWGGVDFFVPAGLTFANVSHLITDYKITAGDCGGGGPRFQINIDDKNIFVYLGPTPNFTGCTLNVWQTSEDFINSTDLVFDLSQYGGPWYGTYAQALALLGSHTVTGIQLVVDGGWKVGGNQIVLVDNVTINSDVYTFDPLPVTVTIAKYFNGVPADAVLTNYASYPMVSSWNATNIGAGFGSYSLGPSGFNNVNPYQATTSLMTSGASYSTNEVTSVGGILPIGTQCQEGKTRLVGYSTGESLADAVSADPTSTLPSFTNIITDKFVVVWNEACPAYIRPAIKDDCKKEGWMTFYNPTFKNQGSCVSYIQANEHAGKK